MENQDKQKSICIFESNIPHKGRGPIGNQEQSATILSCVPYYGKDHEGNNKDTVHIVNCLKKEGWNAVVIKFQVDKLDQIIEFAKSRFCGYMSRINPGELPGHEDTLYDFLRKLSLNGLKGLLHPDSTLNYGSKQMLYKLRGTGLVNQDTYLYQDIELLKKNLPVHLLKGPRVLKRNKGSYGDGVWKIEINNPQRIQKSESLPLDTDIKITFAFNNMIKIKTLEEVLVFCQECMLKDNDYFVDVKYLPLITEGQLKMTLVGEKPMFVLHKIPNGFSTNKISGSTHSYDPVSKWKYFSDFVISKLPALKKALNEQQVPLIWTADFILESRQKGVEKYVLSEINCTCVGFSEQLDYGIQEALAKQIIRRCK